MNKKDRFESLLKLIKRYEQEAKTSAGAGAYLAGCVMLGSALEAGLLAMVECFRDEVKQTNSAPRDKHGKLKPSSRWKLSELLDVARELDWLPAKLSANANITLEEALSKGEIGDFVEVVREIRNLVHPTKYVREYPDTTIKKEHFKDCYNIVRITFDHLFEHLTSTLEKEVKSIQKETSRVTGEPK